MGGDRLRAPGRLRLLGWALCLLVGLSAACAELNAPLPTATPSPTATVTATPTSTPVWFPPTPTHTPRPTPGITPTPDLLPDVGALLLEDDFADGEAWQLYTAQDASIAVGNARLTIALDRERSLLYTTRSEPLLGSFYLEVTAQVNLCSGADEYGVLLRLASAADFYRYSLSCDGRTRLDKILSGSASSPQPWLESGSFPPGAPSTVVLGIWAKGKELRFFINNQLQFSVTDPALPSGLVGLFARTAGAKAVSVSFSELRIYALE